MTNPVSASNAWSKIQRKITAQADGTGTPEVQGTPKATTPKATPKKRTSKAVGTDGNESPTKKAKTPRKAKVKQEAIEEADVDADANGVSFSDGEGEGDAPFI